MNIREQVYRTIAEMTKIDPSEINCNTDIYEIFFSLTQELDRIFKIPEHKNHGHYESAGVESVIKYYEELLNEK